MCGVDCGLDSSKSGALYLKRTYARPIQVLTNLTRPHAPTLSDQHVRRALQTRLLSRQEVDYA
jgi:hypothetical protein